MQRHASCISRNWEKNRPQLISYQLHVDLDHFIKNQKQHQDYDVQDQDYGVQDQDKKKQKSDFLKSNPKIKMQWQHESSSVHNSLASRNNETVELHSMDVLTKK